MVSCKDIFATLAGRIPRRDLQVDDLKALAHPLRQRILYQLAFAGPATSTSIAQAFSESRGAASYHLRQLERFGFIEELRGRARGRERWWQLVPLDIRGLRKNTKTTRDVRAASATLGRLKLERDRSLVDRYLANRHRFDEWNDAVMFSSSAAHLTKKEFVRFTEDYVRLLKTYVRPAAKRPAGTKPIAAVFYAFPWPGE